MVFRIILQSRDKRDGKAAESHVVLLIVFGFLTNYSVEGCPTSESRERLYRTNFYLSAIYTISVFIDFFFGYIYLIYFSLRPTNCLTVTI